MKRTLPGNTFQPFGNCLNRKWSSPICAAVLLTGFGFWQSTVHAEQAPEPSLSELKAMLIEQQRSLNEIKELLSRPSTTEDSAKKAAPVAVATGTSGAAQDIRETPPAPSASGTTAEASPAKEVKAEVVPSQNHTVSKGETLTSICKLYAANIGEVMKLNHIKDARKLQIGQTLLIPTSGTSAAPATDANPSAPTH